ncbi:Uncharacterised protein [Vibrio cholerae]|nr:Uncharacterised protein [Vibrio cholerae]
MIRMFFAIEIDDGVAINRIERALRADRCIRFMVIIANPDKGEDFFAIGDRDRADIGLFIHDSGNFVGVFWVKTGSKDTNRTLGNIQSAA